MSDSEKGQGDLFAERAKRSRVGRPRPRGTAAARPGGAEHAPASDSDDAVRARLRARLELLALAAGRLFGEFMLSDVRREAEGAGLLTGHEGAPDPSTGRLAKPRALAWLGTLLPGLERRELVQKHTIAGRVQFGGSDGDRAHGNKQVIWILTIHGQAVARELSERPGLSVADAERAVLARKRGKESA